MSDLPDYQRNIQVVAGNIDAAEYDATPEDLSDGERGPLLIDVKGRLYVLADLKKIAGVDVVGDGAGRMEVQGDIIKSLGTPLTSPTVGGAHPVSLEGGKGWDPCLDAWKIYITGVYGAPYVDVIDKADRLLGIIYGSQGQQLKQKATTYELLTYDSFLEAKLAGGLPAALDTGALKIREQNPLSGFATESTLLAIKGYVDAVETLLAGGLPAALDAGALKIKEQSPLAALKITDGTYYLATPGVGDAIGRGVFILGSDYGSPTPAARIVKVDSSGRLSCVLG